MKVGVLGASGYAGTEVLRLASAHPGLEVAVAGASSAAGTRVAEHTPALASVYPDLVYEKVRAEVVDGLDVVFLALPHGESQDLVPRLYGRVGMVVDLSADFRLHDESAYPRWYEGAHRAPDLLSRFVYGLPELHREELAGAPLVAAPGCYPTAAVLALAPLVRAGVVDLADGCVVDALSGVSGAGRAPSAHLHFGEVASSASAYGLLDHRHTPEMEQELGVDVLFTPHLVPMTRGILATCYARAAREVTTDELVGVLHDFYRDQPFVTAGHAPPATKSTLGSNSAQLTVRADQRSGRVVALCALDNLGKGAAGQAIQAVNLALGWNETAGLALAGLYP